MLQARHLIVLSIAAGLLLGCSDAPRPIEPGEEEQEQPTLAALVVSQPVTPPDDGVLGFDAQGVSATNTEVAYVSLPPGTLPEALSVVIRNPNTGAVVGPTALVDGGFDPIAVPAAAGDRLELEFHDALGGTTSYYSTVPPRRPPTIVWTNPPKGRTDVALSVQPTLVFSEPLDPATVTPENVRLLLDGVPVAATVLAVPDRPWIVQILPAGPLAPLTRYTLDVRRGGVANTAGEGTELGWSVAFTTGAGSSDPLVAVVHVSMDPDLPPEGATVVGSLAEAMARVEPGGRVLIYDGVHPVENLVVDRPVSFEAASGSAPVIEVADLGGEVDKRRGFIVSVQAGTVSFDDLTIEMPAGGEAISAQAAEELLIDDVAFLLGHDARIALVAGNAPTRVTVRNSTFSGGIAGILAAIGSHVDVLESAFTDHVLVSIQYQMSTGRVEGNTIDECGRWGCIRALSAPQVDIVGNRITTTAERVTGLPEDPGPVRAGIHVSNGTSASSPSPARALIEGNTIEGLGGSVAFVEAALLVAGLGQIEATARGNIIRNATVGIAAGGPAELQGSDNRLESVYIAYEAGGGATLVDNYSDVVDYAIAISVGTATIDARCNWWGSASGPGDITDSGTLPVLYEPWAVAPVAGTGDRSCAP